MIHKADPTVTAGSDHYLYAGCPNVRPSVRSPVQAFRIKQLKVMTSHFQPELGAGQVDNCHFYLL